MPRITPLAERVKAREKDHASIPAHIANMLSESRTPIFDWAADVDAALAVLADSRDDWRHLANLRAKEIARLEDAAPVIVPTSALARFVANGDGTVTDNKTGLMWEQTGSPEAMNWDSAVSRCDALTLAGHTDWRLPTIEELCSIVDYTRFNPACDPVFDAFSTNYWSSSTYVGNPQFAWLVYFADGFVSAPYKPDSSYVRAVRSGSAEVKP